jgi:hypothetical protein
MSIEQNDTNASKIEVAESASREWRRPSMRRLDLAGAEVGILLPSADGATGKDAAS